jgi:hypothetical protein
MYCRLPYVSRGGLSLQTLVLYIYRLRDTMQYNQQSYVIYSSDSRYCINDTGVWKVEFVISFLPFSCVDKVPVWVPFFLL